MSLLLVIMAEWWPLSRGWLVQRLGWGCPSVDNLLRYFSSAGSLPNVLPPPRFPRVPSGPMGRVWACSLRGRLRRWPSWTPRQCLNFLKPVSATFIGDAVLFQFKSMHNSIILDLQIFRYNYLNIFFFTIYMSRGKLILTAQSPLCVDKAP